MQTLATASLLLGSVLTAFGSITAQAATAATARVFGYEDPQTGIFHPARPAVAEATTTPTTGTVEVTFSVKLVTSFAKGTALECTISLDGTQTNTATFSTVYFYEAAGTAVTISGSTATCSTTIPYSWLLPAASSTEEESFSGSYTISVGTEGATGATGATSGIYRSSTGTFVSATKIPASGTTSKYTVDVTL